MMNQQQQQQFDSYFSTTLMHHNNNDGSSTNSTLGCSSGGGCPPLQQQLDPSLYRASIVEGNNHVHIGHYASMPILLSLPSSSLNDETGTSSDNLVASVDGMTCFLDQEYQDCKNRLLMQTFVLPRSSIALIPHQHARKEVTSFIKVSKSISVLDKPSEDLNGTSSGGGGVSKNEFSYLSELWGQMFKLPQTMLKYSGKNDSFWRGSIFSTLYRFITRDFEHLFDENRDFMVQQNPNQQQQQQTKFDGSFFIGLNHQRNKEIRELTRRVSILQPPTSSPKISNVNNNQQQQPQVVVPMGNQMILQIEQYFLNGTFLPFFCSRECNDTNGNQFQAENELAIMLKIFLETQYNFFQQTGAKPGRKRFVTGITCVGPLVTCYIMRRFYTIVENYGNLEEVVSKKSSESVVEPVYIMQSLETFNLSNYDDLLRCAKYMTGVRKFAEMFYSDIRNCLRHSCGLPIVRPTAAMSAAEQTKTVSTANPVTEKVNHGQAQQQHGESNASDLSQVQTPQKSQKHKQQVAASPKSQSKEKVDLKRKQVPSTQAQQQDHHPSTTRESRSNNNGSNSTHKKQKVEISPERSTKEVELSTQKEFNGNNTGEDLSQVSMVESTNGDDARIAESGSTSDLDE